MIKRIFWLVADSFGIGSAPDAEAFGDKGANTLASCLQSGQLHIPTLQSLGLFNIDGIGRNALAVSAPKGSFARLLEASAGKDTIIGHRELAGLIAPSPLPTYPNGFPDDVLKALRAALGRDILCNRPYSGTKVITDYAKEHLKTGALIVYTSADSVLQIAAHESIVPVEELYRLCETARKIMQGEHGVGRVIARPFTGVPGAFIRTAGRRDFSLSPPKKTVLDHIKDAGKDVIAIGKISDIFAGHGITHTVHTKHNDDGMQKTLTAVEGDFNGLCFVNLVDFDMLYGHRRNVYGYTSALNRLDAQLSLLLSRLRPTDILMLCADHGCDPAAHGTDHTREAVPWIVTGSPIKNGVNLGTLSTFADVGATVADWFGIQAPPHGTSHAKELTV